MSEQTVKKHWSEWYAWDKDDIYDIIYAAVPSNNWNTVDIELVLKDGRVDKACMCPYEEYTEDGGDYWKTYELSDMHYRTYRTGDNIEKWRYLNDWESEY